MEIIKLQKLEQDLKIRNYSVKTIKAYLYYNQDFLKFSGKGPREVRSKDIKNYLEKLAISRSSQTVSLALNALKYYYKNFYQRSFFGNIRHPRKASKLPVVLSRAEVKKILASVKNVKHKLILGMIYSAGLRVSEVVKLKVRDLDFDNKIIYVRGGKGNKDRQTLFSDLMFGVLQKYTNGRSGEQYLFLSNRGRQLTVRSVQKIFHRALLSAGIKKAATCHSLRHSFATHLLENGVDIRYIQEILGHKRLETTRIYTKVAADKLCGIKSPLENIIAD